MPLPSRAISHARGHLRVSRFARRTTEKRETARSLTTGGLYRVEVPTPIFLEGEFAACNFRVASKSSLHAL